MLTPKEKELLTFCAYPYPLTPLQFKAYALLRAKEEKNQMRKADAFMCGCAVVSGVAFSSFLLPIPATFLPVSAVCAHLLYTMKYLLIDVSKNKEKMDFFESLNPTTGKDIENITQQLLKIKKELGKDKDLTFMEKNEKRILEEEKISAFMNEDRTEGTRLLLHRTFEDTNHCVSVLMASGVVLGSLGLFFSASTFAGIVIGVAVIASSLVAGHYHYQLKPQYEKWVARYQSVAVNCEKKRERTEQNHFSEKVNKNVISHHKSVQKTRVKDEHTKD